MKNIKNKNKILIAICAIVVILLGYYIYYKNSDTYKEFEKSSQIEELIPYEEEIQVNSNTKTNTGKDGEFNEKNNDLNYSEGNVDNKENISENKNTDESSKREELDTESMMTDTEKQANSNREELKVNRNEEMMLIHITGEVKNWGVIELPEGSRVIDAVNKAGGFTDSADVGKVNLAYELSDGVKVYIPSKNEGQISETTVQEYITTDSGNNVITGGNDVKKETKNELVNINNATQTELETLPGIGPSTALKIISYRSENGKFSCIDDIKNVSGIGDSKFESIRELICV